MGTQQRFAILDGWVARGFRFDIQPITAEQLERIAQSFGPARFAYNWALGQVKADLDARTTDPAVPLLAGTSTSSAGRKIRPRTRPRPGGGAPPRRSTPPASPTW